MRYFLVLLSIAIHIFSCSGSETYVVEEKGGVRYVHNLAPMWGDEERIKLEYVQTFGGLETKDEDYMLYRPSSVAVDDDGNVFISDRGNKHVKKFTADGKYIMTIGEPGQGPGEFSLPFFVQVNNRVLICSDGDSRIHKFTPNGKFIESIRPEYQALQFLLLNNDNLVLKTAYSEIYGSEELKLIKIVEFGGDIVNAFCRPVVYKDEARKSHAANSATFAKDLDENIVIAFSTQNRIEKYSRDGKLLLHIDRSLNFELKYEFTYWKRSRNGNVVNTPMHNFTFVSREVGIDTKGRIWVLSNKKIYEDGDRMKDFLEYEIFAKNGILLTRVPIPDHRFDSVVQVGNRIFILDPYETASVLEYKIVEN